MKIVSIVLLGCSIAATTRGFSVNSPSSRRQIVDGTLATIAATFVAPLVANADVTNKVASLTSIRNVKRAAKQLDTLELYVVNSQYQELKEAIRTPPLSDIRKNCFSLVRGGEDGPDAERLTTTYQKFITSLEAVDNTAGLAIRGRKIKDEDLLSYYQGTVSALGEFVKVAEESAAIPVQYTDDQGGS